MDALTRVKQNNDDFHGKPIYRDRIDLGAKNFHVLGCSRGKLIQVNASGSWTFSRQVCGPEGVQVGGMSGVNSARPDLPKGRLIGAYDNRLYDSLDARIWTKLFSVEVGKPPSVSIGAGFIRFDAAQTGYFYVLGNENWGAYDIASGSIQLEITSVLDEA